MKKHDILYLFIFSSIIFSCNILGSEDDIDPIEGKILFSVTYDSTNILQDHTGFLLLLKTEKIYSCMNYELKLNVNIIYGKIYVQLEGIDIRGELCATALGPATSIKPLNLSEGNYELNINYMLNTDKYSLSINNLNVRVNQIDTSFTEYHSYDFDF